MAKINNINAKDISEGLIGDLNVECRENLESMTIRLPKEMANKLKLLKDEMIAKGYKVTLSDLVRSALTNVFG